MLERLLQRPHNTYELERFADNASAAASIHELRSRGLDITAARVQVPKFGGAVVTIAQYTLADGSRELALKMLGAL